MGTAEGALKARKKRSEAAAAVTSGTPCRVLAAGVDTLDLYTRAELRPDVVKALRELKAQAGEKKAEHNATAPRWHANGIDLEVRPYGVRKASLVLHSEAAVVFVNPDRDQNLPTAYVELKAHFLWSGWEAAAEWAREVLASLCQGELDMQVSRLDLAVDFTGWVPTPEMLDHVFGRVVRRDTNLEWEQDPDSSKESKGQRRPWVKPHHRGRRFTGFSFGGGDLLARLYDKLLRARQLGQVWFEEMWTKRGWLGPELEPHVWRLEFQIRRSPLTKATVLRDGIEAEIGGWLATAGALNELWRYLTERWLSYRFPRTKTERVRLRPEWKALAAARFIDTPDGELYRHQLRHNLNRTTGQFAGYLVRGLAEQWHARGQVPYKERLQEDVAALFTSADSHFKKRHDDELYDAAVVRWRQQENLRRIFGGDTAHTRVGA